MDFLPFLEGQYHKKIYVRKDSVDTTWKPVVTETLPSDTRGIITALAGDNTAGVELDIWINGKSIGQDYGFPIDCDGLPSNKEAIEPMIPIPPGGKYEVRLRRLAGSGTFNWRMEIITIKGW